MKGDSVRARSCYTQAVSIYDSLIAVKKDFGDQVNRAILIQLLYFYTDKRLTIMP